MTTEAAPGGNGAGSLFGDEDADVVVLRAEDLIPERARCARSLDDDDTRYCRECLRKPCRWFSGWRPAAFDGHRAEPDEAPHPRVVREMAKACSDSTVDKEEAHYAARRKLFAEVDKLIRGRVREVLGDVVLEHKQELDKSLGLVALRKRVERVADGVGKDLDAISQQLEDLMAGRVETLLKSVEADAADAVVKAFDRRVTGLVAKECAKQLARVLVQAPKPREPIEPIRVIPRQKKKRTRSSVGQSTGARTQKPLVRIQPGTRRRNDT